MGGPPTSQHMGGSGRCPRTADQPFAADGLESLKRALRGKSDVLVLTAGQSRSCEMDVGRDPRSDPDRRICPARQDTKAVGRGFISPGSGASP